MQHVGNQTIVYTDTRTSNPNSFGLSDGLAMVTDFTFQNCLSKPINGFTLRPYEITTSIGSVTNIANTAPNPQIFNGTLINYNIINPCTPPCNISLQVTKSVDACSNATFTGIASGGTGPYAYQWDISCDGVNGTTNPYTTPIGPGTIPFCVTVTDATGCTAVLTNQTVVGVRDLVKPEITCPSNIQLSNNPGQCYATYAPIITVTDNCDPMPVCNCTMTGTTSGPMIKNALTQFNVGTTTVTCNATDASGNVAMPCVFTVTVFDAQPHIIMCPPNITISCDQNESDLMFTGQATVSDNCQGVVISHTDSFTGNSCSGIITRTWSATDASGAIVTCVQLIKKEDNVAPMISCPAFITINCDQQPLPSLTGTPQVVDNCQAGIVPTYTDNNIGTGCDRYIQRTWTANDGCGNIITCTQNIYFSDQIAPVVTCPINITISCNADTTPSSTGMATATDNCTTDVTIRHTDAFTAQGCTQDLIRTWTATDACGNVDTCVQTITLIDTILPNIVCPPDLTLSCGANTSSAFTGEPTISDFCQSNLIVTYVDENSGTPCDLTITRTWTVDDGCGNVDTCVQTIKVEDKTPPTFVCPPSNVNPIECTTNPSLGTPTLVTDNCGGKIDQTKVDVFTTNGCFTTVTRTWTVTDQCGNTATCNQVILMQDTKAPVITNCGRKFTVQGIRNPDGICYGNATISTPNVTDACSSNVTITNSFNNTSNASSGNYPVGQTIVTWTAKDDCGLMAMCQDTVAVVCESDESFCGWAAATCYANSNSDPVGVLYNVSNTSSAPIGNDWTGVNSIHPSMWTKSQIGDVFGICFDNSNNVYLAATDVYNLHGSLNCSSGIAGDAGIYVTNLSLPNSTSIFVKTINSNSLNPVIGNYIPNTGGTGNAIGNITFDKFNTQFFATNLEDGRIYRISPSGNLLSSYDPYSNDVPSNGICPNGESNWGVAINKDPNSNQVKLYFARSKNLTSNPKQIWSVELLPSGEFSGSQLSAGSNIFVDSPSEVLEIDNIPGSQNIITDIEFSTCGKMIIAERGSPHNSNVIQYENLSGFWSLKNTLNIGATSGGILNNSAGGVDYGYVDANNSANTAEIIWATGNYMMTSTPGQLVYGLEGISPSGNSPSPVNSTTDLYIDFDEIYNTNQKSEIGDIDIYKCKSCITDFTNCNNISADFKEISSPNDSTCCYSVSITNNESIDITKICLGLINSPDWLINTGNISLPGYNWSTTSPSSLCIENASGIPLGTTSNVFSFCLAEMVPIAKDTQCIEVSWCKGQIEIACKDTLKTYCSPSTGKDTCFVVSNISSECDPQNDNAHCITFTINNISTFTASDFILGPLPAGHAYADCGCGGGIYPGGRWNFNLFPGLAPNTSTTLCVKIISSVPILETTDICFGGSIIGPRDCCKSPYPICVNLEPCCDPCSNIGILTHKIENQDSCCYAVDLKYNCDYNLFNSVSFNIVNVDVHFGSYSVGSPAWNLCLPSTSQQICIAPSTPSITNGLHPNALKFCLTDIDDTSEVPQFIAVNFNGYSSSGKDTILCDTLLEFNCQDKKHPCTFITNEKVECIPDSNKYKILVTVQNISNPNFIAGYLDILSSPTISPDPVSLVPTLPNDGTTRTVTFCYTPPVFPDPDGKLELVYKLINISGDSCCNGNQVLFDTLTLPPCDSICGYACNGQNEPFEFNAELEQYGPLTIGSIPVGFYPEYGKPTVVEDGCNELTKSIALKGITRGFLGDAAGVHRSGFVGPDTFFRKGNVYCITYCAKFIKGLASSTAALRLRATDGTPVTVSTCPIGICENIGYNILATPNAWQTYSVLYTPSSDFTNLVFSNHSTDPLDVPPTIYVSGVSINSAIPVTNDVTPPDVMCPPSEVINDTDNDCIINYSLPTLMATDDNGVASLMCYLDGVAIPAGSTLSLDNSIVHIIKCVAIDVCDNKDSCQYNITVFCKPQDTLCKCGGFSKTKFCLLSTGTAVETECNFDNKVYNLPCPGTSLVNYCGTFKCNPDTCSLPAVNFVLTNTNSGTTIHTANLTLNAMGKFTINLLPSWCNDPSVIYEIKVSGVCGDDTCVCITKFKVNCPQKNLCKCDDKFFADVAQGFLQSSVGGNCLRKFEPRSLCPSDKVEWYRNAVLISTTTGMTSSTFPVSAGFGVVCMIVTRTESPNLICKDTFCSRTYCKPEVGEKCSEIDNSEMVNNIDGYIDDDGTMTNWTKDEGWPYAFGNEGISDGNIMLIASKDMPSAVRTNRNGAPPKQGFLTFELDAESYSSDAIPEGTTLELEGITSTGQRVLLSNVDVAGIRKGWDGTIKRDISMPAEIYSVVLRLSTSSTKPALLRIDNFCIDQTVGTNDIQNELNFSIYPNPTTGQLTIQFESSLEQDVSLKVLDILGRQRNSGFIQKGSNHHHFAIDDMAGIYIIQLTDSNGHMSQRKVIKME